MGMSETKAQKHLLPPNGDASFPATLQARCLWRIPFWACACAPFSFSFRFSFLFLGLPGVHTFHVFLFFLLTQAFHCTFNATLSRINCHWPRLVSWHAPAAPAPAPPPFSIQHPPSSIPISISLICAIKNSHNRREPAAPPRPSLLSLVVCLAGEYVSAESFSSAIRSKWQLDAIQGHCFP